MKTIPESLQESFNTQLGVQPLLVLGINWNDGNGEILYSTHEFETDEEVQVYKYVQEFGDLKETSHTDGFGTVNSITVTLNDYYGYFKSKLDAGDIYNINIICKVYVTIAGINTLMPLYMGRIEDPISWEEATKTLTIDIISKDLNQNVGYTPSIDEISTTDPYYNFLKILLNKQAWPIVFGNVEKMETVKAYSRRQVTITDEVEYDPINHPVYDLPVNNDIFTKDSDITMALCGRNETAYYLLVTGQFKDTESGVVFRTSAIEPNLYDETDALTWTTGNHTNSFTGEFGNDYIQLSDTSIFAEGMTISLHYEYTAGSIEHIVNMIVTVTEQVGSKLKLEQYLNIPETATNLTVNWIRKSLSTVEKIENGAKLFSITATDKYIVDSKNSGTTVNTVYIDLGDDLKKVDSSLYTVKTSNGNEDANALWLGEHNPCTYIEFGATFFLRYLDQYIENDTIDGIIVDVTSTYDTDAEILDYLISSWSAITNIITDADVYLDFVLASEDSLSKVVGDIAFQTARGVRRVIRSGLDTIEFINLRDYYRDNIITEPVHTFTDANILENTLVLSVTSLNDLKTVIKADTQLKDTLEEPLVIVRKNNVAKYGELTENVDFYVFNEESKVKSVLDFWIARHSTITKLIEFTAFLDSFKLEVYDLVQVSLTEPSFFTEVDDELHIQNHLPITTTVWNGAGYVRHIKTNLSEGLVTIIVEILPGELTFTNVDGNTWVFPPYHEA